MVHPVQGLSDIRRPEATVTELTDLSAFCWKWTMPMVERANSEVAAREILEARDIVADVRCERVVPCTSKQWIAGMSGH